MSREEKVNKLIDMFKELLTSNFYDDSELDSMYIAILLANETMRIKGDKDENSKK